jgi:predicted nucleotidyltransferase
MTIVPTPPEPVRVQIAAFVQGLHETLAADLRGVYLHGSLAMGCFNPARSDVDLLVVTERGMAVAAKRRIVELLLRHSASPCPIEISFLCRRDLDPWEYPTPYDLHFGEDWRERYQQDLATGAWQQWNDGSSAARDADLAAHITITHHRGLCLAGLPIAAVFPPVPKEHYLASILADCAWALERLAENPVYAVLNLCRVHWYVHNGQISSKAEAGDWGAQVVPEEHRPVITQALAIYRGAGCEEQFAPAPLERCAAYLHGAVQNRHAQNCLSLTEDAQRSLDGPVG